MSEVDDADRRGRLRQRGIRVFVSSTFVDMQGERDELVKRVFPAVRVLCESRGVTWGEVDLRWGITDERTAEGKVLEICLDEIRGCRPYFIGGVGQLSVMKGQLGRGIECMIEALDGLSSSRCHAGRRAGANGDRERSAQDHAAGAPHTGARRPGERPAGVRRSERGAACGGRYRRFGRRPKRPWRGPDPARDTAGALDCYLEAHDCFTRAGNTEGAQLVRSVLESIGAHLMRDTTGMLEASNECSPERLTELIDKLRQAGRALRIGGSPEALASALRLRAHLIGNYYAPALLSWGENERTRDVLREEIALQRELGNREAEAIAVSSLGLALQRLGSLPEALASQPGGRACFSSARQRPKRLQRARQPSADPPTLRPGQRGAALRPRRRSARPRTAWTTSLSGSPV